MNSLRIAESVEDYVIEIRRIIHQNPEKSSCEFETQALVIAELEKMGIEYKKVGNTSTIAYIRGELESDSVIAFRADIDALPMDEQTDVAFKSKNKGLAHMCGHDAHCAMLLGTAKVLNEHRDKLKGEFRLFFQEAEETLSGAHLIIEAGGMDNVDKIYALHCIADFKTGELSVSSGYQLSGSDLITIKWNGVSGHGSTPHKAKDSLQAAATFVANVQTAIYRTINPQHTAVLSCGVFNAGQVANIIPNEANTEFTFRYYQDEAREISHEIIKKTATNIADIFKVTADVIIKPGVKAMYNSEECVEDIKTAFSNITSEDKVIPASPLMSSEDFSKYLEHASGAMAWLGVGNEDIEAIYYPHHDKWKIDEAALKYGVATFFELAINK